MIAQPSPPWPGARVTSTSYESRDGHIGLGRPPGPLSGRSKKAPSKIEACKQLRCRDPEPLHGFAQPSPHARSLVKTCFA